MAAESREEHDRSGAIWQEGLRKFPNSTLLKVKLGFYYYMRPYNLWSDHPAADYKRADELAREVAGQANLTPLTRRLSHWLMAFVYSQEGQYDAAVRETEAAAALAPYDAWMTGSLANVLITAGRVDTALEWVDAAEGRDPANRERFEFKRGWILTVKGESESALNALEKAPNWIDKSLLMAINHVRLDRLDEAKADIKKALAIDPKFTQSKWRQGYFYSDPAISEREIADLAKAGLPEK
jgi:tetratricopeptide (TPR) repeat protein